MITRSCFNVLPWALLAATSVPTKAQDVSTIQDGGRCAWLPVAEFSAQLPLDPRLSALRTARNRRFSLPGGTITEDSWGMSISSHPGSRTLGTLVDEADVIVEGRVEAAEAFVSENRQVVYSELRLRVERVLKDRYLADASPLREGDNTTVLREGGLVRLPSGRIVEQTWNGQHVPGVDSRALLFLLREPAIEGLTMLTGYRIADGTVCSLDLDLWFPRYAGEPLDTLRAEIATLIRQSRATERADEDDANDWDVAASPAPDGDDTVRRARNRRFSRSLAGRLTTDHDGSESVLLHARPLTAEDLVQRSAAIIEGRVEAASASVAGDSGVVYSEFQVRVEQVFADRKSSGTPALQPGDVITVLREGGAVQRSDGRVVRQRWNRQRLPRPGADYLLFMNREPRVEGLIMTTGYHVEGSVVHNLDGGTAFPDHEGIPIESVRERIRALATRRLD